MPLNKLRFFQNTLSLSAVTLIIVVWATVSFLAYQNNLFKKYTNEASNTVTKKEEVDLGGFASWKTYSNKEYGVEFKYPSEFFINQNGITSKPVVCKTNSSGSETEISVSEINIKIVPHSGNNYKNIWKDIFGFEFDSSSYDGETTIGGKKAYFFYTGGEEPEGKQSFLVDLGNQKALEIIVKSPTLVYGCSGSVNKYNGYANQIISTLKFDKSCSSCPLYSPPAPGWCKNGTIVAGEKDECGCQQPPTCLTNN